MKKWVSIVLMVSVIGGVFFGCNTNKPADEVKGAKERVKKKMDEEKEKQKAENPGE